METGESDPEDQLALDSYKQNSPRHTYDQPTEDNRTVTNMPNQPRNQTEWETNFGNPRLFETPNHSTEFPVPRKSIYGNEDYAKPWVDSHYGIGEGTFREKNHVSLSNQLNRKDALNKDFRKAPKHYNKFESEQKDRFQKHLHSFQGKNPDINLELTDASKGERPAHRSLPDGSHFYTYETTNPFRGTKKKTGIHLNPNDMSTRLTGNSINHQNPYMKDDWFLRDPQNTWTSAGTTGMHELEHAHQDAINRKRKAPAENIRNNMGLAEQETPAVFSELMHAADGVKKATGQPLDGQMQFTDKTRMNWETVLYYAQKLGILDGTSSVTEILASEAGRKWLEGRVMEHLNLQAPGKIPESARDSIRAKIKESDLGSPYEPQMGESQRVYSHNSVRGFPNDYYGRLESVRPDEEDPFEKGIRAR